MAKIIVVAHNIRSSHNVGALFRTCDGLGVSSLALSGYTPHPSYPGDTRLPHIRKKITDAIHKTALGAERTVEFTYTIDPPLKKLKRNGYTLVALEQTATSTSLTEFHAPDKIALVIGEEVEGIQGSLLAECDRVVEIPMVGKKESFNVSIAAAIALYHIRFVR